MPRPLSIKIYFPSLMLILPGRMRCSVLNHGFDAGTLFSLNIALFTSRRRCGCGGSGQVLHSLSGEHHTTTGRTPSHVTASPRAFVKCQHRLLWTNTLRRVLAGHGRRILQIPCGRDRMEHRRQDSDTHSGQGVQFVWLSWSNQIRQRASLPGACMEIVPQGMWSRITLLWPQAGGELHQIAREVSQSSEREGATMATKATATAVRVSLHTTHDDELHTAPPPVREGTPHKAATADSMSIRMTRKSERGISQPRQA